MAPRKNQSRNNSQPAINKKKGKALPKNPTPNKQLPSPRNTTKSMTKQKVTVNPKMSQGNTQHNGHSAAFPPPPQSNPPPNAVPMQYQQNNIGMNYGSNPQAQFVQQQPQLGYGSSPNLSYFNMQNQPNNMGNVMYQQQQQQQQGQYNRPNQMQQRPNQYHNPYP